MLHAAILVPITPTTGFTLHLLQQLIKTKQRQGSTFLHRRPHTHSTGNGGAAAVDVSGYWSGASLGHLPFFETGPCFLLHGPCCNPWPLDRRQSGQGSGSFLMSSRAHTSLKSPMLLVHLYIAGKSFTLAAPSASHFTLFIASKSLLRGLSLFSRCPNSSPLTADQLKQQSRLYPCDRRNCMVRHRGITPYTICR